MGWLKPQIRLYPDEPHPNDQHRWKSWWIRKMFDPEEPLYAEQLQWVHQCWRTTMAGWPGVRK